MNRFLLRPARPCGRLALAAVVLSLLLASPARAGDEPESRSRAEGPSSLAEMEAALAALTQRLEKLMALARKDARFRDVETYKAYNPEDFEDRDRKVKAEDLLDIIADADAPRPLRQRAYEVLTAKEPLRHDPDLRLSQGQHDKPRNTWCIKNVVKLLSDKDADTRKFAHEMLKLFFPTLKDGPPVLEYDWKEGSRTNWRRARNYWVKSLKR